MNRQIDAIIVGGGLAGLAAARAVAEAGFTGILLEARDRVGGRVLTRNLAGTELPWNLGAVSITPEYHLNIAAEIKRYGLKLNDDAYELHSYCFVFGGKRYTGKLPGWRFRLLKSLARQRWTRPFAQFTPAAALALRFFLDVPMGIGAEMGRVVKFFVKRSSKLRVGAGFSDPVAAAFDVPLKTALQPLHLSKYTYDFISATVEQILAASMSDITLLNVLQLVAMLDNNPLAFFAWDRDFKGGNRSLPYAILNDVSDVRLNSPVNAIVQTRSDVEVTLFDGSKLSASRVIVATPMPVWGSLAFDPPLNAAKRALSVNMRVAMRAVAIVGNLSISALGTGIGPGAAFTYAIADKLSKEVSIVDLVALEGVIDLADTAAVEAALQIYYPGVEVLRVDTPKWESDPYTQQTWNINYPPGTLSRYQEEAIKAEGRLHFCCSDLARGWIGWQDGALEAGKRAGAECVLALRAERPR